MNLITLHHWNAGQILEVIEFAQKYKQEYQKYGDVLKGKTLLMIFEKTSTRTRISFESGFSKLGGHAIYMDARTSNLVLSELMDEARYMTRNVDMIMGRMLKNQSIVTLAEYATVPVINGCCDLYHPCQILSDLLTIQEEFGRLEGLTLAYIGIRNNVCNDLLAALPKVGMRFYQVTPLKSENQVVPAIDEYASKTGKWIETDDIEEAIKNADIVYTDTWINMEFFGDSKYKEKNEEKIQKMMPYQVNGKLIGLKPGIKIMHDMPMHPGYEITREVIEHPGAIIFPQAGNRMWAQNALMLKLFGMY
ncbi:MAG: ornithine carbamoyltransferase [Firmicutes bacterium]|nr:ornithine carbamoyltransferase [Bacillota bacterium]